MSKPFEFKADEDAKPLTKKEAMEAERKLIQWIFSECETCLNSRPVVSENGIHHACCLSGVKAFRCMIGTKDQYIGLKDGGMRMAEQLRPYMCEHFKWTSWNHYGVKMPEFACKLKGGFMGSCGGICKDFKRKVDDNA